MRVYVATKFEKKAEAQALMTKLRAAGHEVVGDWTNHTVAGLGGSVLVERLRQFAQDDQAAVEEEADAFVLLPVPPEQTRSGAHLVELGMAITSGSLVCVLGGRPGAPTDAPIFFLLPEVHHFDTEEALLKFLHWAETAFRAATADEEE